MTHEARSMISLPSSGVSLGKTPARPDVAVVIPLYNGGAYIEEALRSVLAQTIAPREIVVVDDGSSDDGPALVEALALRYPINLLRKPNGGQSAARNFGVAQTRSELIALLDQDDLWYPHHLELLMEPFIDGGHPELGWVYSDLDEVDETGALIHRCFLQALGTPHPKRDLFSCIARDMFVLPSGSLISRRAFEAVGGFDERLCGYEDDDLFLRLFRAGYRNVFLPEPTSRWRIHLASTSYSSRMARSRAIYVRKLLDAFPDDPGRGRHYTRDLIIPRFLPQMLAEFRTALRQGNAAAIAQAGLDLSMLLKNARGRARWKLGAMLLGCRTVPSRWLVEHLLQRRA